MGSVLVEVRGPEGVKPVMVSVAGKKAVATHPGGFDTDTCTQMYNLCRVTGIDCEVVRDKKEEGYEIDLRIPSCIQISPPTIVEMFCSLVGIAIGGLYRFTVDEIRLLVQGDALELSVS